jgi:hypothetical protein
LWKYPLMVQISPCAVGVLAVCTCKQARCEARVVSVKLCAETATVHGKQHKNYIMFKYPYGVVRGTNSDRPGLCVLNTGFATGNCTDVQWKLPLLHTKPQDT